MRTLNRLQRRRSRKGSARPPCTTSSSGIRTSSSGTSRCRIGTGWCKNGPSRFSKRTSTPRGRPSSKLGEPSILNSSPPGEEHTGGSTESGSLLEAQWNVQYAAVPTKSREEVPLEDHSLKVAASCPPPVCTPCGGVARIDVYSTPGSRVGGAA